LPCDEGQASIEWDGTQTGVSAFSNVLRLESASMHAHGWIDRAEREPSCFPSILVLSDGRRFPITITNVSECGCQVSCAETLPIGAMVDLKIGEKLIPADVRWSIDGKAGLRLRQD